jgi:hypothetical protein
MTRRTSNKRMQLTARQLFTELKHTPLKDLCYLGGWKEPQTVLKCYQRADETGDVLSSL